MMGSLCNFHKSHDKCSTDLNQIGFCLCKKGRRFSCVHLIWQFGRAALSSCERICLGQTCLHFCSGEWPIGCVEMGPQQWMPMERIGLHSRSREWSFGCVGMGSQQWVLMERMGLHRCSREWSFWCVEMGSQQWLPMERKGLQVCSSER